MHDEDFARRAAAIRWLLCDVDGVLTDGRLTYGSRGEQVKRFHVRDGLAFKLAQRAGLQVGLLSSRGNAAVERRAAELGLNEVLLSRADKAQALAGFLDRHQVKAEEIAYVGDDLPDLPVLLACGLSFCPADAVNEVRQRVRVVLATPGGHGAVRELVEQLLSARGQWAEIAGSFLPES